MVFGSCISEHVATGFVHLQESRTPGLFVQTDGNILQRSTLTSFAPGSQGVTQAQCVFTLLLSLRIGVKLNTNNPFTKNGCIYLNCTQGMVTRAIQNVGFQFVSFSKLVYLGHDGIYI